MLVRTREGETEETGEEGDWRKRISSVASASTFSSHVAMEGGKQGSFAW